MPFVKKFYIQAETEEELKRKEIFLNRIVGWSFVAEDPCVGTLDEVVQICSEYGEAAYRYDT